MTVRHSGSEGTTTPDVPGACKEPGSTSSEEPRAADAQDGIMVRTFADPPSKRLWRLHRVLSGIL
jgi:hypothetical protein